MSDAKISNAVNSKHKKFQLALLYFAILLLLLSLGSALIHTLLKQQLDNEREAKKQLELFLPYFEHNVEPSARRQRQIPFQKARYKLHLAILASAA